MLAALVPFALLLSRRGEASGGGCAPVGCFLVLLGLGLVLYLVFRGRGARQVDGAASRPMSTAPMQPHTFACPFSKCPNCGAAPDKQKQQWDGLRAVTWTCGYCGNSQVQQLTDDQLPPSARQRLGLDGAPGQPSGAYPPGYQGGSGLGTGLGGVMTGMMLGSMLGGGHHHNHHGDDGWGGGSTRSSDNWDSDSSGDSGGGWDSGGDSGGDWGGGGDSGGDSGGDW